MSGRTNLSLLFCRPSVCEAVANAAVTNFACDEVMDAYMKQQLHRVHQLLFLMFFAHTE